MTTTYCVLLPATVYTSREVVEKPMTRYRRTAKQHQITATQVVAEAATMITTVKAWSREAYHQRTFDEAMSRLEAIGRNHMLFFPSPSSSQAQAPAFLSL